MGVNNFRLQHGIRPLEKLIPYSQLERTRYEKKNLKKESNGLIYYKTNNEKKYDKQKKLQLLNYRILTAERRTKNLTGLHMFLSVQTSPT